MGGLKGRPLVESDEVDGVTAGVNHVVDLDGDFARRQHELLNVPVTRDGQDGDK